MTYTIDEDGEHYKQDENGNDIVGDVYAKLKIGGYYYPKNFRGDEFFNSKNQLIIRDGVPEYPLKKNGRPNYRVVSHGKKVEVYEKINNIDVLGMDKDGNQIYAQNEFDEYYPSNNSVATTANGSKIHAKNIKTSFAIYLSDGINEFYPFEIDISKGDERPDLYAKKGEDEFYPIAIENGLKYEYILRNTYACKKKRGGSVPFYPKDAYNNEYYLPSDIQLDMRVLERYALTNDGKVILPLGFDGSVETKIGATPQTNASDTIGKIIRKRYAGTDYLTSVEVTNKPTVNPIEYKYRTKRNLIITVTPPNAKKVTIHTLVPFIPIITSPNANKGTIQTSVLSIPYTTPTAIQLFKTWYFWLLVISSIIDTFAVGWVFSKKTLYNK